MKMKGIILVRFKKMFIGQGILNFNRFNQPELIKPRENQSFFRLYNYLYVNVTQPGEAAIPSISSLNLLIQI